MNIIKNKSSPTSVSLVDINYFSTVEIFRWSFAIDRIKQVAILQKKKLMLLHYIALFVFEKGVFFFFFTNIH